MDPLLPRLHGKTALVTGSSDGLGLAMAEGLARAGCNVVLHGLEPAAAVGALQAELEHNYGVAAGYVQADLGDPRAIERMMEDIFRSHGAVDVLVNNAVTRDFAPIESFPVASWDRALAVNVSAAFHTIRLCLPAMRQRRWGRIVNMSSVYGSRAVANRIDYVTTKTALLGITRSVAVETVGQGITCNAICPGTVFTPNIASRVNALMQEQALDFEQATLRFLDGKQPTQRFIEASHVADLLVFLCGRAGENITGAMLPMEGGWLAS
jgi:3-hydroxybutyrate dehydrogenase